MSRSRENNLRHDARLRDGHPAAPTKVGGAIHGADEPASGETVSATQAFDFSNEIGPLIRKAFQHHAAVFQRLNCEPQLTAVQLAVLWAIDKHGASSLRSVGKAASLDAATTGGVVERLTDRGLVTVQFDPSDKRKVLVDLSDEGHQLLNRMLPFALQIGEVTMQELNPGERIALLYLLRKLTKS